MRLPAAWKTPPTARDAAMLPHPSRAAAMLLLLLPVRLLSQAPARPVDPSRRERELQRHKMQVDQYRALTEEERANPNLDGDARASARRRRVSLRLVVMITGELNDAPVLGAGIVFGRGREKVYVVTANHVVRRGAAGARNLQVKFRDSPSLPLPAELLGQFDASADIAVLSVDTRGARGLDPCSWFFFQLAEAQGLKRGDPVYPVGNPNGFGWGMPVTPDLVAQVADGRILFQSTFLSPGHSGGALLDPFGFLAGMIQGDQPPFGVAVALAGVLQKLRDWGYLVELYQVNDNFENALEAAAAAGDLNTVRPIVAACPDVNALGFRGRAPLHIAAMYGQVEVVRFLLAAGADVDARGDIDSTALELACLKGRLETVRVLLAAGAAVNQPDRSGRTPLHLAAREGHVEVINLLCAQGADVNAHAGNGETPLHIAAAENHVEAVNALLARAAVVDARTKDGRTPLHEAVANRYPAVVKALLAGGADPRARTQSGDTPLDLARLHPEIRDLLRSRGGKK